MRGRYLAAAFWGSVAVSAFFAIYPAPLPPTEQGDKINHMLAFATMMVLGGLAYPRRSLWSIAAALVGFGMLIELVQAIPALNRDSSVADLIADVAAIAAGLAVAALLRQRIATGASVR